MRCQKNLQIIMPKHRKLLSKLGTWEKPNSSIFLKNKLQDLGGESFSIFFFFFPKKERNGTEWNVEGVCNLVISFFFFFHCFLFPRKKGMEWNVDSRGCGPASFIFIFFLFFCILLTRKNTILTHTNEFLGKKINDPNSPYFEK